MPDKNGPKTAHSFTKSDSRYWLSRVVRRREGSSAYSSRLEVGGTRCWFNLETGSKREASRRAAEIYIYAKKNGIEAAKLEFKSKKARPCSDDLLLGEFLAAVEKVINVRGKTFKGYSCKLRIIVSSIFGLSGDSKKFGVPGRAEWVEKVHRVPVSQITPSRLTAWKMSYINTGPAVDRDQRVRTANNYLRSARTLFREETLELLEIEVPRPLPFEGMKIDPVRTRRYISSTNALCLVTAAQNELPRNQKLIVLFGLCAGLRREEMDTLLWRQLSLLGDRPSVDICQTEYFLPKSESSYRRVDIDDGFARLLMAEMASSSNSFVLEGAPARPEAKYYHYRANKDYRIVTEWLRSKGVKGPNPIHALRKEWGSLVNSQHGLKEASVGLGHANIGITASTYTDSRKRLVTGLGDMLSA